MNVKELVGKRAIRTAPVDLGNGHKDFSYGSEGLLVLAVTDSHIVVEHTSSIFNGSRSILGSRWVDDNWTDYDELMKLADETKKSIVGTDNEQRDKPEQTLH